MATQVDCPPVQGSNAPKESGQPWWDLAPLKHMIAEHNLLCNIAMGSCLHQIIKNPSSENYRLKEGKFLVKHSTSMTHTIDHKGKTHFWSV